MVGFESDMEINKKNVELVIDRVTLLSIHKNVLPLSPQVVLYGRQRPVEM